MKALFSNGVLVLSFLGLAASHGWGAAQPIPGVDIIAKKNPGGVKTAMATTNAEGGYFLADLPPGNYALVLEIGADENIKAGSQVTITGRVSQEMGGGDAASAPPAAAPAKGAATGPAQFSRSLKTTTAGGLIVQEITVAVGTGRVTGMVTMVAPPAPASSPKTSSAAPSPGIQTPDMTGAMMGSPDGSGSPVNGKMSITDCERMCKTRCDCEGHNANCSCVIPGLPPSRN